MQTTAFQTHSGVMSIAVGGQGVGNRPFVKIREQGLDSRHPGNAMRFDVFEPVPLGGPEKPVAVEAGP